MEAKATKVSKTESHEGSQKGVFNVCKGKLILVEITREERVTTASHSVFFSETNKCYKQQKNQLLLK